MFELDHVALQTSDIAASVAHYVSHYGAVVLYQDATWAFLKVGQGKVALVTPSQHPPHLALRVDEAALQRAAAAVDPVDVWRFGTLATSLADSRFRHAWTALGVRSDAFRPFAPMLWDRALSQVKKRTEERKKTLFGLKAPTGGLQRALQE